MVRDFVPGLHHAAALVTSAGTTHPFVAGGLARVALYQYPNHDYSYVVHGGNNHGVTSVELPEL